MASRLSGSVAFWVVESSAMAARPTWKGYLKISLVNIPIRVFPATDSAATVSFNQLHGECGTRIKQKKWCPTCEKEVTQDDLVKGYTANPTEIARKVNGLDYQIALMLRPTPLAALEALGKHGEVMPQKSTYFYPKLATGMVMNSIR